MDHFNTIFYRFPRLTFLAISFVLMLGASSFVNLPRQEDPTMTERFALVETLLPGASATRVESLITEKVENGLREVPEVKKLTSTTRVGYSNIRVELIDAVTKENVDLVWSQVRDKLSDISNTLPTSASEPDLNVKLPVAVTLGVGITGDNVPFSILERVAIELRARLASQASTRETDIHGEPNQEILVEIDHFALSQMNLSITQLVQQIKASDTKLAAGEFNTQDNALVVEVKDEFSSIERLGSIPLRSNSGSFLRLSDVANIRKHYQEPAKTMAILHGKRGILVTTTMESGQRVDQWVANAKVITDNYASELPSMISVEYIIDQNFYTEERLLTLLNNLLMAISLVLVGLFFLMGYRSALIIGMALPLTLAMVLAGLQFLKIPLHQMSVTGLIIALGLLIDNAIVVVEEYKIQRRRGKSIVDGISASVSHLFVPLLASTATTAFAFLPIALTPGGVGDFTGTMAIAVVLSVSASFILAMTIIPALAGFIDYKFPVSGDQSHWYQSGFTPPRLTKLYQKSIKIVLQTPLIGILVSIVLPICGFLLAGTMTTSFFPPVDRNQFQIQLTLPSSVSVNETYAKVEKLKAFIDALPEVTESHWFIGEGTPAVYYNMIGNNDGVASFAGGFVTTKHVDDPRVILPKLQQSLMDEFPEARVMSLPFEQGPPFSAPIEIRILGPDLKVLKSLGEEIRLVLSETKDVTYTTATLAASVPQISIYPNETLNNRLGLNNADLPMQLNGELTGLMAGTVMEGATEVPVRVKLSASAENGLDKISDLSLMGGTNAGQNTRGYNGIPLEQLAEISLEPAPNRIDRHQNERVNTVSGFLLPYAYPSLAVADFRQRMSEKNIVVPKGYKISFGGEEEQRGEAVSNIITTFLTFLWLMIAVIVLSLNSFRFAGIIGVVGVLSVGLALLGVWLSGYPLGYTALIGTLGLVGLSINGAIIVLSALRASDAAKKADIEETTNIVVEASRHIISTTITTIGGFIPLILFGGHFWPPLAMAIAGGVAGSAILALYFVPSMFIFFARRNTKMLNSDGPAIAPVVV